MKEDKVVEFGTQNARQTILLIIGMLALFGGVGFALFGTIGLVFTIILGVLTLSFGANIPTEMLMRFQRGQLLSYRQAPELFYMVDELRQRANLSKMPQLYYIQTNALNAFATGTKENPAIGVTAGILKHLDKRELTGVLAHEISHIKNDDLKLQRLAAYMSRMTGMMGFIGQILLFINLPLMITGSMTVSWLAIALLLFAPTISSMLFLALSRVREFVADMEAAQLTNDPQGLANALRKLDYLNKGGWWNMFRQVRAVKLPKFLMTHPTLEERIARLNDITQPPKVQPFDFFQRIFNGMMR